MDTVIEDGLQIVREALDEQVTAALARRRMTVSRRTDRNTDEAGGDTVLATCRDFTHSPLDEHGPCRQTFLSCLDCGNARAFPRHLPLQLLVRDELEARRATMPVRRWVGEYAGRIAQLDDVISEYEPAQRDHARREITAHRHLLAPLLSGDPDPL